MTDDCTCAEQPAPVETVATGVAATADLQLLCIAYGPHAATNGFDALATEWNQVVQRSRFDSFFLTHEWQTTWWNNLGEGDLWIIAFRTPNTRQLVGIAPLYLVPETQGEHAGEHHFYLVGCIEVSDYLDVIAAQGWEHAVYDALLAWLASPEAPAWDAVDLCNIPEASLTYHEIPPLYRQAGFDVEVRQEDTAPQFALPMRYDDYLQTMVDKKQRHEIRRKQRRAEREAAAGFILVGKEHVLEAEVDDFVALQRASRDDKADFMTPEMRRFFLAVARRTSENGTLRLFFLTLDGEKAATLFAFEYNRRFWLYNSGYDPSSHATLSPGWVLLAYAIQYAIASGCQVFDFMQGGEEYKYRFGAKDYKVMRVIVRRAV